MTEFYIEIVNIIFMLMWFFDQVRAKF